MSSRSCGHYMNKVVHLFCVLDAYLRVACAASYRLEHLVILGSQFNGGINLAVPDEHGPELVVVQLVPAGVRQKQSPQVQVTTHCWQSRHSVSRQHGQLRMAADCRPWRTTAAQASSCTQERQLRARWGALHRFSHLVVSLFVIQLVGRLRCDVSVGVAVNVRAVSPLGAVGGVRHHVYSTASPHARVMCAARWSPCASHTLLNSALATGASNAAAVPPQQDKRAL